MNWVKEQFEWYKNIEEPIRQIVYELRNNGINTFWSCGHDMTIDCELTVDGDLKTIHDTIYNHLCMTNKLVSYTIEAKIEVENGIFIHKSVFIKINK